MNFTDARECICLFLCANANKKPQANTSQQQMTHYKYTRFNPNTLFQFPSLRVRQWQQLDFWTRCKMQSSLTSKEALIQCVMSAGCVSVFGISGPPSHLLTPSPSEDAHNWWSNHWSVSLDHFLSTTLNTDTHRHALQFFFSILKSHCPSSLLHMGGVHCSPCPDL